MQNYKAAWFNFSGKTLHYFWCHLVWMQDHLKQIVITSMRVKSGGWIWKRDTLNFQVQDNTHTYNFSSVPKKMTGRTREKNCDYQTSIRLRTFLSTVTQYEEKEWLSGWYLWRRDFKKAAELVPCDVVAVTLEQLSLIEETVHRQEHVGIFHLPSAVSKGYIRVEGVMHNNQHFCFVSCEHAKETTTQEKGQEATEIGSQMLIS